MALSSKGNGVEEMWWLLPASGGKKMARSPRKMSDAHIVRMKSK